ncbi:MAG: tripartite tricarboxylate transporter substrate binding protein [Bacillota bacterium]
MLRLNKIALRLIICMVLILFVAGCGKAEQASKQDTKQDASHSETKKEEQKLDYPKKPITVIVPYSPGGSASTELQVIVDIAKKYLPVPLVMVNKPGGGGSVGMMELLEAPADGYTIVRANTGAFMLQGKSSGLYDIDELVPIAQSTSNSNSVFVSKDSPYKNLKELLDTAKKSPGKMTCAIVSKGGYVHLLAYNLLKEAGAKCELIPHDGGSEVLKAVMGGHVDFGVAATPALTKYHKSGDIRVLAVFTSKRAEALPDVPTVKESGINLASAQQGLFIAKKGVPEPILKYLEDAFQKILTDEECIQSLEKIGAEPEYMNRKQIEEVWKEENPMWRSALEDLGYIKKK